MAYLWPSCWSPVAPGVDSTLNRFGQVRLFEIRTWDQSLPAGQHWRVVASIAAADIEQVTIVRPGAAAPSVNGQHQASGS